MLQVRALSPALGATSKILQNQEYSRNSCGNDGDTANHSNSSIHRPDLHLLISLHNGQPDRHREWNSEGL